VNAPADTAILQDAALVPDLLHEYGQLTREGLRRYLPRSDEAPYLDALVRDYPERDGKMLRSTLCLASARAFGAEIDDALASAVAIELMHNALLIHDDIQDGSLVRRGRPTLHALHGVPLALNAGDALSLLSIEPLNDNFVRLGHGLAARIVQETRLMARETTEGQALELGWQRDNRTDVDEGDYLTMVLKKTCWLTTIHPLRLGCLIGGGDEKLLARLTRLGYFFGAAFQIHDDVLNLNGDAVYGKELNGDLHEGKRTLILIHALRQSRGRERQRALCLLGLPRERRGATEVAWLRRWIDDAGSLQHACAVAGALAGAALIEFDEALGALPESRDLRFLRAVIPWVLRRNR
jgi:geranylgeranyl diphosphate synthase type II